VDTRIASKLQKLKEQTASMGTMEARKQEDQLMAECKVMHARMLLASDDTGSRNEGVDIIIAYLADIAAQRLRFPQLCSSALSAYGAYVLTLETSVPQHYLWFPFVFFDPSGCWRWQSRFHQKMLTRRYASPCRKRRDW
jgi:hypothetical protein